MHNQDNEFSPGDSDYEFNTHLSLAHRCDCDSCTELSKSMIIIKNWIKKNPHKEGLRGHHYTIIFEETKNLLLLEDPKYTIDSLRSDLFALVEWEGSLEYGFDEDYFKIAQPLKLPSFSPPCA